MKNRKNWKKIGFIAVLALVIFLTPVLRTKATEAPDGEPTIHRLGRTTARVNVRYGAGEGLYDIIVHKGEKLTLNENTEVIIVGEEIYKASGNVWYEIIFQWKGEELTGWATSTYVNVIGTITPTPLPATPTPSPSPTPTPEPTPSPTPTQIPPTPTQMPTIDPSTSDFRIVWGIIAAIVLLAIVAIALIFIKNRFTMNQLGRRDMSQKMRHLKNINLSENKEDIMSTTMISKRKRPPVRIVDENDENREYDPELIESIFGDDLKEAEKAPQDSAKESEEKRALRQEINHLKPRDLVYHLYFGSGEVYDNSDVKLLEVRFGSDVRFLNKESLVNKKLLRKIDEDKLAGRKKD